MDSPTFLIIMAAVVILLILMMNRNRKLARKAEEVRNSLTVGDDVMTTSGLYGTITEVEGNVVTIESSPGVSTKWFRPAIAKKVDMATEYGLAGAAEGAGDAVAEAPESSGGTPGSSGGTSTSTTDGFLSDDQVRRPYRDEKKD